MLAFKAYSSHDLEAMFGVGLQKLAISGGRSAAKITAIPIISPAPPYFPTIRLCNTDIWQDYLQKQGYHPSAAAYAGAHGYCPHLPDHLVDYGYDRAIERFTGHTGA